MKLPAMFGLVDLGIVTVIVVFAVLPPREQLANAAYKADDETQFKLAAAEARAMAHPDDGLAVVELGRRLGDAGFKDWAVEKTLAATSAMPENAPSRWRAFLATSVAYIDRLDVMPGQMQADLALKSCKASSVNCPSWEEIRVELYKSALDAGIASGIDPRKDPKGFRAASMGPIRPIQIGNQPSDRAPAPTPPAPKP